MTVALVFVAGMITTALLYGLYSLYPREELSGLMPDDEPGQLVDAYEAMRAAVVDLTEALKHRRIP